MRFLVVEDTADVAETIVARFSTAGHVCDHAGSAADARHFAELARYDVVILDINLPDGPGTAFLRWLRERGIGTPVLVLTARLALDDKIATLDEGADDYMVKPFDLGELEARVRAVVRRHRGEDTRVLEAGNLSFDMASRATTIAGEPCELTRREQILLEIFLVNRGRVLEKEELLTRIFGMDTETSANAVELYVGRLRRKIAGSDLTIRTLRGLGYQAMLAADPRAAR
ncbi:response regulator [Pararhizobium mangrovi]|uniref:Response regulator transcription factor n=1 Tax=Pararhizobium mangrovi TaxID=2590452 RepID=A0A506TY74_9HYPH|nr:response regulator transcription factor [Pararhizobium mangrovi]TPW26266.1 response regulator transcription factor [Pararhizobium mangrovi]